MITATKVMVHLAWLGDLWFILRYSRVRWRATPAGVNAMATMLVLGAVMSLAVLAIWWPRMPGGAILGLVSWAAIAAVVWHRVYVFEQGQRDGRRALRDNRSATEDSEAHGT